MNNINTYSQGNVKKWKDLKAGDTVYFVFFHQATTHICKHTVQQVENTGSLVRFKTETEGSCAIYVYPDYSVKYESGYFWRTAIVTTLEGAKRECKRMTDRRIKEIKEEIKKANARLRKWEGHRAALEEEVYIIK